MNLDSDTMKAVAAKAIVDSLTPEDRQALLQGAVAFMLEPKKESDRYGARTVSPLQAIFEEAAQDQARALINAGLREDPVFQKRLKKLWSDIAEKLWSDDDAYEKMVSKMADSFVEAMRKDRY